MYQALYRKWRPRTFDEVVGQDHITETLKRQVAEGHISHAYLFTGTRGTGKTSCAKILARAVNCLAPVNGDPCNACTACKGIEDGSILDVLELDAASNNGVDQVRALRDEAIYSPSAVRKRVYIVDEVHMLSTAAFNALLKILEEPPEHLMFILATTELNKVPATIRSRCQQFAFKRISPTDIAGRVSYVAGQENIQLTGEGAALIARLADGGMRDALSLLDQCNLGGGALGEQEILDCLGLAGNVETARLMEQVAGRDAGGALETLNRLYGAGKDVESLISELAALARDLLVRRTAPRAGAALLTGGYDEGTLRRLAEALPTPRLAQVLGHLQKALAELPRSANRRTDAELCLIRLCDESLDETPAGLNARMSKVEALLERGGTPPPSSSVRPTATDRDAPPPSAEPAPVSAQRERTPPSDSADPSPRPAPTAQDAPPWDMEPPPAAAQRERSFPSAPAAPAPRGGAGTAAPAPAVSGDVWPGMLSELKPHIPFGIYVTLKKPGVVQALVADGTLTLWVENDLARGLLSKQELSAELRTAAGKLPGGAHRVEIVLGKPPVSAGTAPAPEPSGDRPPETHDSLEDLMALGQRFDNIIIEE